MPNSMRDRLAGFQQAEFRGELDSLVYHVQEMTRSPQAAFKETSLGKQVVWYDGKSRRRLALALMAILKTCHDVKDESISVIFNDALAVLLKRGIPFTRDDIAHLLGALSSIESPQRRLSLMPGILNAVERAIGSHSLDLDHRQTLLALLADLATVDKKQQKAASKFAKQIESICNDSFVGRLRPDGGWADKVRQWLETLEPSIKDRWCAFLCEAADVRARPPATDWRVSITEIGLDYSGDMAVQVASLQRQLARSPCDSWKEKIAIHLKLLGPDKVADKLKQWLLVVATSKPSTVVRESLNRDLLRGLLLVSVDIANDELTIAIQQATKFFYKNNSPLALIGVIVLHHMGSKASGAALATLALSVKAVSQRSFIDSACESLAEKLGLDPSELADGTIPTFGFTELGSLRRVFGDTHVELNVERGFRPKLVWSKADGKVLKAIPARIRRDYGGEVDSLKLAAKGVREALSGLALRLESSWLTQRRMRFEDWQTQLIDHYVASLVSRKLIWKLDNGNEAVCGCWHDGQLRDSADRPIQLPRHGQVSLWHPQEATANEALAWRQFLESNGITQPFKQAHREIYQITQAELATRTYSNRFASHIIRQAQFRQLAKARGWNVGLVGPWGGENTAAERKLPRWGLRAEFWVNGTGDEYQTGYTYLSTDLVRFYRGGEAEPLPLDSIPPLVFSEIMRDVDLFVGVASVGNDPNWSDGGPNGQYREYWHSYSFGELSATAQTRRALLERLIPRLKIADRCTLSDRFLEVRGAIRTYKIHLGSGNILMAPNDQYLCIVPKQTVAGNERVHLPFEGDQTLSIILSKAFLLADDAKIKDPTIVSQIAPLSAVLGERH
ncbi:MAG: DUF4132 domain-containing protein [Gemmataceae bacterium]